MTDAPNFSRPRKAIAFYVDDDRFDAAPVMPAETLMAFAARFSDVGAQSDPGQALSALKGVLEMVLLPDSYTRLCERLRSREEPIDLDQLSEIVPWLIEQYGLRPTRPQSKSPSGQPSQASGTPSTESTPDAASTSSPSLSTAS